MPDVTLTQEQLLARVAELEAAVAAKTMHNGLEFRVGAQGGISVYGLQRFPVTLYSEQFIRLLCFATGLSPDDLKETPIGQFIEANRDKLAVKSAKQTIRETEQSITADMQSNAALTPSQRNAVMAMYKLAKSANPTGGVKAWEFEAYSKCGLTPPQR